MRSPNTGCERTSASCLTNFTSAWNSAPEVGGKFLVVRIHMGRKEVYFSTCDYSPSRLRQKNKQVNALNKESNAFVVGGDEKGTVPYSLLD